MMVESASSPPQAFTLDDYDSEHYGPLLGVSDEGSAVGEIVRAAQQCAKAVAAGSHDPRVVGLIVDGERMTSGGEAPIGPQLYERITSTVGAAAYSSTNVSIRVNVRTDHPLPEFAVTADSPADTVAEQVLARFLPFVKTPDRTPRPLRVRLMVAPDADTADLTVVKDVVTAVEAARSQGHLASSEVHQLGLLVVFDEPIDDQNPADIERFIDLAKALDINQVALDGPLVAAAQARFGVQGLLNIMSASLANRLLSYAHRRDVALEMRYTFDEISGAVGVWTGVVAARSYGLSAAKYGLAPLTLDEQDNVVATVQPWVSGLKAIPAFYADTPLVTRTEVLLSDDADDALQIWLEMVARHAVDIVLVDCPDRIEPRIDKPGQQGPRRLLRDSDTDPRGVFTVSQVADLLEYGRRYPIRILWSGGITAPDAFELGAQRVFGVFSTSSTALPVPVGDVLAADQMLAAEGEPTFIGVRRVHALLQAGFLSSVLADARVVERIRVASRPVRDATVTTEALPALVEVLDAALVEGWRQHWDDRDSIRGRDA